MIFHHTTKDDVLNFLESNLSSGLSENKASELLKKYGENRLAEKKQKSLLNRFLDQFNDVMILILLGAAALSFIIAFIEQNPTEFFEPVLILLIVVINASIGVLQENKAEKALKALNHMSAPHARVIRDARESIIDAFRLVPGDIIRLEAGDFVPADARLLKAVSLKSEEAALTGESVPAEKTADLEIPENAPLGDRLNMVFSGCSITYGTAVAVVTATGMNTEIGKIAHLLNSESSIQTPLQKKLTQLGKYLGILAILACSIIFVVGILNGIPKMEIFMTAVSLAVSAIPEGLPAIVTIVLSIGVERMAKRGALIRKLPAVETLGSASVICSDKTGTLTQNKMTLTKAYVDGENGALNLSSNNPERINKLLIYATLCSDATVIFNNDSEEHLGDPTETAIIVAAQKAGIQKDELNQKYPRLFEIPFDSSRKLMTTINRIDEKNIVIVKGAFDVLRRHTIKGDINTAKKIAENMSSDALRVLAVAYKEIDDIPENPNPEHLESELTFMGLVGMIDPPRPEVKTAVNTCLKAGIKPIMITGDHIVTASAIAKELGILKKGDSAITGSELDKMTDEELQKAVEDISVYARVSPENKIRIVKAWQNHGHIVSMTGDGVNDAPALKAADIGCAMGITGTDVAKGAADMTLTDDNFATIVDAVFEGRGIYSNIKKVVGFLLETNIGEVITVFIAMLFWHKTPLLSIQLLWINLVTDSLPAIALGMESVENDIMLKKPRSKDESIFAHGLGIKIFLQGVMFAILTLTGFKLGENLTGILEGGQTMAFIVLSLCQIVQAYNMRSYKSIFKIGPFTNKKLNVSCLISITLVMLVLFTPIRMAFGLITLSTKLYLSALGLSFVPLIIMELSKALGLIKHRSA